VVDHRDAADRFDLSQYGAIVLGSAVYLGRWLKPAERLADRLRLEHGGRPVWLFSSGPIVGGDDAEDLKWARTAWAVEHHMFGGKLDRAVLSWHERLAVAAAKATDGDRRSEADIDQWAATISASLSNT
jgi:menaquinone-dependent protoporphyrinogen oxidase